MGWTVTSADTSYVDDIRVAVVSAPEPGDAAFEQPYVGLAGTSGSFIPDPTGTAWMYAGGAGVSANGSAFTTSNPPAPEGG